MEDNLNAPVIFTSSSNSEVPNRISPFKEVLEDESRKKRRRTQTNAFASSSEDSDSGADDDDTAYRGNAATHSSTTQNARSTRGVARSVQASLPGAGADQDADRSGTVSHEGEDSATSTRRTRRSGPIASQEAPTQTSFASSVPASRLTSQSQSDEVERTAVPEADAELISEAASLSIEDDPISKARYEAFKAALGQLQGTPLFDDDSANVEDLIAAVNSKVGARNGGQYGKIEAIKALKMMDQRNEIM